MKRFSLIAAVFVFAAMAAVSASAQAPATAAPPKIVVINSAAFADKDGITKYSKAIEALDLEFKPTATQINAMGTKIQGLVTEIENARKTNPAVPVKPEAIQAKVDEADMLNLQFKRAKEDAQAKYQKRQAQVLEPIMGEIMKGLDDFAKAKGYALILDAAKLATDGVLLALDPAKVDVTKEFIAYYNQRPATPAATAAAAPPK